MDEARALLQTDLSEFKETVDSWFLTSAVIEEESATSTASPLHSASDISDIQSPQHFNVYSPEPCNSATDQNQGFGIGSPELSLQDTLSPGSAEQFCFSTQPQTYMNQDVISMQQWQEQHHSPAQPTLTHQDILAQAQPPINQPTVVPHQQTVTQQVTAQQNMQIQQQPTGQQQQYMPAIQQTQVMPQTVGQQPQAIMQSQIPETVHTHQWLSQPPEFDQATTSALSTANSLVTNDTRVFLTQVEEKFTKVIEPLIQLIENYLTKSLPEFLDGYKKKERYGFFGDDNDTSLDVLDQQCSSMLHALNKVLQMYTIINDWSLKYACDYVHQFKERIKPWFSKLLVITHAKAGEHIILCGNSVRTKLAMPVVARLLGGEYFIYHSRNQNKPLPKVSLTKVMGQGNLMGGAPGHSTQECQLQCMQCTETVGKYKLVAAVEFDLRKELSASKSATDELGAGKFKLQHNNGSVPSVKHGIKATVEVDCVGECIQLQAYTSPFALLTGASQRCQAMFSLFWFVCFHNPQLSLYGDDPTVSCSDFVTAVGHLFEYKTDRCLSPEHRAYLLHCTKEHLQKSSSSPDLPDDDAKISKDAVFVHECERFGCKLWIWIYKQYEFLRGPMKDLWCKDKNLIAGFMSKKEAEQALSKQPCGTFLLRLSEKLHHSDNSSKAFLKVSFVQTKGGKNKVYHIGDKLNPQVVQDRRQVITKLTKQAVTVRGTNETKLCLDRFYPSGRLLQDEYQQCVATTAGDEVSSDAYCDKNVNYIVNAMEVLGITVDDPYGPYKLGKRSRDMS